MTPTNNSFTDTVSDDAKSLGDRIANTAAQVKNKVNDYSRAAADMIEETRVSAAKGLERTASALNQGGDKVTDLAHSTADKLNYSAEYLRKSNVRSMMANVEQVVRRNPGPSLIAAGVIGFLLARTLRRGD